MNIIGEDCCDIILDYKTSFDLILKQNKDIVNVINETYCDKSIFKMNILYNDFKILYKETNIYNKFIKFTINCYGNGHKGNKRLFDLDLYHDDDEMLYDYTVTSIKKNVNNKCVYISLYDIQYDYEKLDIKNSKTIVKYNSDVEMTDENIDDFLV